MGERKIASLVPPRLSASAGGHLSPVRGTLLPVVELLALPRAGSLRYGMARVDSWGVVSNRSTIEALGWCSGDRLHYSLIAGSVVVHRHPSGAFAMPNKRYVVLPAPVRRRCGVRPGEQVLVVADPNHDVLVVHPLAALDSMITAYHASLVDGGAGGDHAVPYWNRLEARWGDRTIDEPTPSEIQQLAEEIKATAVVRRNSRGGRSTAPTMGDAALCRLTGLVAARA